MFCANLPQLQTLQWRMATNGPERPNHFSPAFVVDVASQATKGLQLLQVLPCQISFHHVCAHSLLLHKVRLQVCCSPEHQNHCSLPLVADTSALLGARESVAAPGVSHTTILEELYSCVLAEILH
jgi:hypothetical protein